jgi:hypothetical protein
MKNFASTIAIILIIAVIIALVYNWTRKTMSCIAERLLIVEREIEMELENLKLAKALKEYLDRKIKAYLFTIKVTFCLLLSITWILLFKNGNDWMNSLFDAFDLLGILYLCASYLLFNKITEVNTLVSLVRKEVQVWVYMRSKFDDNRITEIEYRIAKKQNEADLLRKQLLLDEGLRKKIW